jgi:predicted patatin/cPLA2 family phospholipase
MEEVTQPPPAPRRHPVLDLLRRRAANPDDRGDGQTLALAIEGGGMRGVVSAGMAAAIERRGLTPCFDLVVGTSAGALNGAAMLGGVAEACCNAYHGAFTSRRFINPYRLLIRRAAVDVAYTLNHADEHLDADRHHRTATSLIPLHCMAVDIETATPAVLSNLRSVDDLRGALLASSRMPWVGGEPVAFRGRRFLDGGLAESIPYRTAIDLGATHVLVLQTRPYGVGVEPTAPLADRIITRRLRALNPRLLMLYQRRPVDYERAVGEISAATDAPSPSSPYVYGIRLPAGAEIVSRLERHADPLRRVGAAARLAAERVLDMAVGNGG